MKHALLTLSLLFTPLLSSGGFDHGTATGKGQFELDFTWNPFNYFEQGQSYVVFGFGLTNRLDIHGYYSIHAEGFHTFYTGLFYQFLKSNRLDLATAIGLRKNRSTRLTDIFVPQLLYTINLKNDYAIGGSFVNLAGSQKKKGDEVSVAIDIALLIPLQNFVTLPSNVYDMKLALGLFNPVTNTTIDKDEFIPTYSLDIKFSWK